MTVMSKSLVLFIRSLEIGGAERQLVTLALALHAQTIPTHVLTFYRDGQLKHDLDASCVPVETLDKRGRWDVVPFLWRFVRFLWKSRPAVLYTYLPVANVLGVMLKPLFPATRIVWGVRASNMDLSRYDWLARVVFRAECRLSRHADLIIANSEAGRQYHLAHGFPGYKMRVIPNGIDTTRFRRNETDRSRVRSEWAIRDDEVLVGLVARIDPMKDHQTFLEAARLTALDHRIRFACVGDGDERCRSTLDSIAERLGLSRHLIWAGAREDMAAVYSALDIAVSSSYGEGFSNALAEAMSCEVPCVATDVGDSAWIIEDTGKVVPPRDPGALARGIDWMCGLGPAGRAELGRRARERVETHFSASALADRTLEVLGRFLELDPASAGPEQHGRCTSEVV